MSTYRKIDDIVADDPTTNGPIADMLEKMLKSIQPEDYVGTQEIHGRTWWAVKIRHPANKSQALIALSKGADGLLMIGAIGFNLQELQEKLEKQVWA